MNKVIESHWVSKHPEVLPDFIIGGAMKSGTTTLHAILNKHPDIALAHNELGFFDIDNLLQHADFNFFDKTNKQWISQNIAAQPDLFWDWYHTQFENLRAGAKVIGEDSTTYLASRTAAKRISEQAKPIKMLFILRHPTARTISNYLHLLKSGRAIYNLEDTLRYQPQSIINRSMYVEHLQDYYAFIPKDRIKVVLFEDLINDRETCIHAICEFLNVDFGLYKLSDLEVHSNKTLLPKYIWLQLLRNKWMQGSRDYRYARFVPMQPASQTTVPLRFRLFDKIHKYINPKQSHNKFVPNPSTVDLLDTFFKTELKEIDELTQQNIYTKWFPK